MALRALALTALLLCGTGCASVAPKVFATGYGRIDTRQSPNPRRAHELKTDPERVQVVGGQLPPGLSIRGEELVVDRGYEQTYRVLGRVEADLSSHMRTAGVRNLFFTWRYDQKWRNALCWPQVPLKILTAGLWLASPSHYPCVTTLPAHDIRRQEHMTEHLQRAGAIMGGDMVVVVDVKALADARVDSWGFMRERVRNMAHVRAVVVAVEGPVPDRPQARPERPRDPARRPPPPTGRRAAPPSGPPTRRPQPNQPRPGGRPPPPPPRR